MEPPQKIVSIIEQLNMLEDKFSVQYQEAVDALEKIYLTRENMGLELLETQIDTMSELDTIYWSINRHVSDPIGFSKYLSIITSLSTKFNNMNILFDYAYTNSIFVSTFLWSTLYKYGSICSDDIVRAWIYRPAKWQYFNDYWHDCELSENNMLEMYFGHGQVVKAVNERPVRRVPIIKN